jgi:hypothetical protein
MTNRTVEDHFRDWETDAFGYSYGTGEKPVLGALRIFLDHCKGKNSSYDYKVLEKELTPVVAWLLINRLCQLDIIDYGTSPRYGWLTKEGCALRDFMCTRDVSDLYTIVMDTEDDKQFNCTRIFCNCGPHGYSEIKLCHNPFWVERQP